jgi:Chitobiase/beta-hexosaminidase C-terminal domain
MRTALLLFSFLLFSNFAQAQNAGAQAAQAAQQATQQAMQANQQAIADMQHASDQAALANQQAMANLNNASQNNTPVVAMTMPPKISVKSGAYTKPITVKLSNRSRGVIMYYTTDGWTPTTASTRYTGPITIDSTTTLRVIAMSPYSVRSLVTSAVYTFPASSAATAPPPATSETPNGAVPVRLLFAKGVNSKTAEIGDNIPLTLVDDLVLNGAVVAHKGAPASVTIIQVDKTGAGGAPGNLEFQIDPLQTDVGPLKLRGSATLEGQAVPPNAAVMIPVVGLFTLFRHGKDADIKSGTPFTAYLAPPTLNAAAQ